MAYLRNRQVGASEAVYRVLPGLHLKHSNITTIFVQSGFPENRTVHFKRVTEDDFNEEEALINEENIDNEDEEESVVTQHVRSKSVKLAERTGKYNQTISIHERYFSHIATHFCDYNFPYLGMLQDQFVSRTCV